MQLSPPPSVWIGIAAIKTMMFETITIYFFLSMIFVNQWALITVAADDTTTLDSIAI